MGYVASSWVHLPLGYTLFYFPHRIPWGKSSKSHFYQNSVGDPNWTEGKLDRSTHICLLLYCWVGRQLSIKF